MDSSKVKKKKNENCEIFFNNPESIFIKISSQRFWARLLFFFISMNYESSETNKIFEYSWQQR